MDDDIRIPRRRLLQIGAAGAGLAALTGAGIFSIRQFGARPAPGDPTVASDTSPVAADAGHLPLAEAGNFYIEAWPTSALILNPFIDPLPIPQALRPV